MNKEFYLFLSIFIVFVIIVFISTQDILNTPDFNLKLKEHYIDNKKSIVFVNYIPPNTNKNIRIMDTILLINNNSFFNIYDLKKNYLYNYKPNDIVFLTVKRKSKQLNIPVQLTTKKTISNISFLRIASFIILLTAMLFYVTFPFQSPFKIIVFLFYCCITSLLLLLYATFEKWYIYSLFIIVSSITPFIALYGALILNNILNKRIFFYTIIILSISHINWLYAYFKWVFSFSYSNLQYLSLSIKISQLIVFIILLCSIVLIIKYLLNALYKHHFHYMSFATLFILIGFLPVLFLFTIPVMLGKHEIVSLDINLLFLFIPLLLLLIYNNFVYEKIYKDNSDNTHSNRDYITFSGF